MADLTIDSLNMNFRLRNACGGEVQTFRGVQVLNDDETKEQLILISGMEPPDVVGCVRHSREMAIIRAGLEKLGVMEVLSGEFGDEGFFMIVRSKGPLNKVASYSEGCYTLTVEGTIKLGHLLKGLNALVWRAWEQGGVPQLKAEIAAYEGAEEALASA